MAPFEDLSELKQTFLSAGTPWMEVLPRYDGPWLGGIVQSVLALFGGHPTAPTLPQGYLPNDLCKGVRRVVLVIADALGLESFVAALRAGRLPSLAQRLTTKQATLLPLTSCFPSTTAVALTTLATGVSPAASGQLGMMIYLQNEVANLLAWKWAKDSSPLDIRPEEWLSVPTLPTLLDRLGVPSYALLPNAIAQSALSVMRHNGAHIVGTSSPQSVFAELAKLVEHGGGQPAFIEAYWSNLDAAGHGYGPDSADFSLECEVLDLCLGRTLLDLPPQGDVLLLLTADHGQIKNDLSLICNLADHPQALAAIGGPPAGTRRVQYMRSGTRGLAHSLQILERELGEVAWFLPSEEAWRQGLHGFPSARLSDRTGDILCLAKPGVQLYYPYTEKGSYTSALGAHGGLTRQEMLVPLVAMRL